MNLQFTKKTILTIIFIVVITIALISTLVMTLTNKSKMYKATSVKFVELGEEIELRKNEKIYLKDKYNTTIKYITYVDSRCLEGTQCIWEGEISYTFEYNGETRQKITLGSVKTPKTEIDNYKITLVKGDTKTVTIKIEQKE